MLQVSGLAWALLGSHGWHLLAVLTSLPVAVSLVWAIVVMPESPRYVREAVAAWLLDWTGVAGYTFRYASVFLHC